MNGILLCSASHSGSYICGAPECVDASSLPNKHIAVCAVLLFVFPYFLRPSVLV